MIVWGWYVVEVVSRTYYLVVRQFFCNIKSIFFKGGPLQPLRKPAVINLNTRNLWQWFWPTWIFFTVEKTIYPYLSSLNLPLYQISSVCYFFPGQMLMFLQYQCSSECQYPCQLWKVITICSNIEKKTHINNL